LEQRVSRLDRSREEYDALCVFHNPLQSGGNSGRRGGPNQEHCIDTIETRINGLGGSEIAANHVDLWWETCRAGVARQCADLRARGRQSRDNVAANGASPSDNENLIHAEPIVRVEVYGDQGSVSCFF